LLKKEFKMAKYLVTGSYTVEGIKGVLKEGGTARVEAVRKLVESLGGKLESMYFAFGDDDFFIITDGPGNVGTAAATMVAGASGAANVKTTVLLTAEEVDEAAKMSTSYRPPGQ
jgi:uncharacterized protein with GYD domain